MRDDDETPVRVLRVFTDTATNWGNRLGAIEGHLVGEADRQRVAHQLGFSETIFIDDRLTGALRIFTPAVELALAGHPLVGAAWLLGSERRSSALLELRPPGGLVRAWSDSDNRTWIDAPLSTLPDWTLVQLGSPAAIGELSGPLRPEHDHVVYWAWIEPGVMRVRCFAPKFGVPEDEATGSAALRLTAALGQPIEIRQGKGSLLHACPIDSTRASVGGLVVEDEPLRLP
ncbi:MAG: PhzF family phenazine biosynthesis protein [Acidimicrobiales bacterium]|jgi:predicted PhzF superfamily epimerase YddE/YHI9